MRQGEGTKFTIDRKIFTSDIWHASPWKLKIWLYLLGNANHKDGEWMGIPLKRGQLIRSYRTIQKDCHYKIGYRWKKPSLGTISAICEELTKDRRITLRKEHGGQVITILNYNGLQSLKKHEPNRQLNASRTLPEHNKNVKNDKEVIVQQADFFRNKIHPYFKSIKKSCEVILKLPKKTTRGFNPYQFVNKKINKDDCHPGAVDECLSQLVKNWSTIKSPWSYANIILKTTDGNWWEKEHIQDHQRLKAEFNEYIESSKLKNLLGGIGK